MKKEFSVPLPILILLIVLLVVSFVFNLLQYTWADEPNHRQIVGTFCTSNGGPNALYIVLNRDGVYRIYTQFDGLLEEGYYKNYNRDNQFFLEGTSGETGSIVFSKWEDGVYYASGDDPTQVFFFRLSDIPTYLGEWTKSHDLQAKPAS